MRCYYYYKLFKSIYYVQYNQDIFGTHVVCGHVESINLL